MFHVFAHVGSISFMVCKCAQGGLYHKMEYVLMTLYTFYPPRCHSILLLLHYCKFVILILQIYGR